jgi:RNA polymerase sigma-70 factor (ECF subfamily)
MAAGMLMFTCTSALWGRLLRLEKMKTDIQNLSGRLWEQALVIRLQAGDEDAFGDLVHVFEKRLTYYVRRLTGNAHDAADVMQDVWVDVYRQIPKLRSPRAFRAWLYRIARNKVYSMFRRQSRWMTAVEETEIPDVQDGPEFEAEDAEQIHGCLDMISPEHREVLTLRFLEDMSYEEIAEATGLRLGTVQSRIHYAKRELRRQMKEVYHE